jgi:hypothetical protein
VGDDFNRRLLERLNAAGEIYLTHAVLAGNYTLRLCVGQAQTDERHVRRAWQLIHDAARELQAEG